jgi:hypothetical protein
MPLRKPSTTDSRRTTPAPSPDVIVDVEFDRGVLHLAVINVSDQPAHHVAVAFDPPFRGLGGEVVVSSLALFRGIEFLAPRKRIATLLDTSSAYFERREPLRITATVQFQDGMGRAYERQVVHDLSIYRDLSYLVSDDQHGHLPR